MLADTREIAADEPAQWEEWAPDYADRVDPVVSGRVMSHILPPTLDCDPAAAPRVRFSVQYSPLLSVNLRPRLGANGDLTHYFHLLPGGG